MTKNEAIEYFYEVMESGNIKNDLQQLVYETAIEALEKQIPKKPIDRCMFSECPNCGNVEIQDMAHCPDCGQALDWGENLKE